MNNLFHNKKTEGLYLVIGAGVNKTNANDGQKMILYISADNLTETELELLPKILEKFEVFTREAYEFMKKFERYM